MFISNWIFIIFRLILASALVSIKYNEDHFFSNSFYAKVGGITKKEIDKLEYEFLSLIDFSLYVDDIIFNKYNNYLIEAPEEIENNNDLWNWILFLWKLELIKIVYLHFIYLFLLIFKYEIVFSLLLLLNILVKILLISKELLLI